MRVLEEGERVVAPLRRFGPPALDELVPMRYLDLQGAFVDAPQALPGFGNYWKAEYLAGVPDAAVDAIVEHVGRITSPYSYVELDPLGGAISCVEDGTTAVLGRRRSSSRRTPSGRATIPNGSAMLPGRGTSGLP